MTECERLKIATTGSKWNLIDKILKHNKKTKQKSKEKKTKNFLNKTKKTFDTSSAKECTKFILNAYIHQIKLCLSINNIENHLIKIISTYLGENILMRFDICPYDYIEKEISHFGHKISRGKHNWYYIDGDNDRRERRVSVIYGCSIGFRYDIHSWKIKINGNKYDENGYFCWYDYIGIAANIKINNKNGFVTETDEAYFIKGDKYIICGCIDMFIESNHIKVDKKIETKQLLKPKDVIMVILNCNKWTVTFKINGKKIGKTVNIAKDKMYYPLIYSNTDFCKFSLIYTTH
eukprot:510074_1